MRQQYHSRVVGGHHYIWDVSRLVRLSSAFTVKKVALSAIRELDEAYWFETGVPDCRAVALHAKLILETDLSYPVILSSNGRVMDGMHRVCKALLEGRSTIAAVQFSDDPEPDYIDRDLESLPYDDDGVKL